MLTPKEVAEKHIIAVKGGDPFLMADDYALDALLVRGNNLYHGKAEILRYFKGVPQRMGSASIEFLDISVKGPKVTFLWQIDRGANIISGKDVMIIESGLIQRQEVFLLTDDF